MDPDVIIVGAGPAGAAAAFDLAAHHLSVLLLDKAEFPRKKACAGGLTVKACRALRYSVAPVIHHACCHMVISKGFKKAAALRSATPLVFMTDRAQLDDYCLSRALNAGASFRVVNKIHEVSEHDAFVETVTGSGTFRSAFLIGADGANSLVRNRCAPFSGFRKGFAIEADMPADGLVRRNEMIFDFGVVPSGYGWVFLKNHHVNIGLYTHDARLRLKIDQLARYSRKRLGTAHLRNLAAYPVGLGGWAYRPRSKRIFLTGDAAGLADPLLGEGLHNAIKSGQASALAILRHRLTGENPAVLYHQHIKPIQADARLGHLMACWFYRFPSLGYAMLNLPPLRHRLISGYAGGKTLSQILIGALGGLF